MGPIAAGAEEPLGSLGNNMEGMVIEPWEKAPSHVVDHEAYCLDYEILRENAFRAGQKFTSERDHTIMEMRQEFPEIWGVRGKAAELAKRWHELTGESISVRTIQNYFHETRAKT